MPSSGDGQDNDDNPWGKGKEYDNVIPLEKRRKEAKKKKKNTIPPTPSEPLINLPPYTKYLLGLIIGIHIIVAIIIPDVQAKWVFEHLGFIPGRFTGILPFEPLALLTPLTHTLLHGSWLHIGMNAVMLLAFGSGIERWMGGKKMVIFFIGCCLFGVAAHFALNYDSPNPVIGASGGLSGLFAAALMMLNNRQNGMTGRYGIWPFVILWIGISIAFGMMSSPDGGQIAWAAHVGGFLGGFLLLRGINKQSR